MEFIRIRTFYKDGRPTSCDHLYVGNNRQKAFKRFLKDYPEHKDCIILAEDYDSEDSKNEDDFKIYSNCGCVHFW